MSENDELDSTVNSFKEFSQDAQDDVRYYSLRLYITGMGPRSAAAYNNIKSICDEYLAGRYELEVIDIYQHPERAKQDQIIAAPTLVKTLPEPLRRMIGDLSDNDRLMLGLDLKTKDA